MAAINMEYVPKFDYKEIETTTMDIGRVYHTPVGNMSSLTTMLGATADTTHLDAWRKRVGHAEADKITNAASAKGTRVHDLMELYVKGESLDAKMAEASELVISGFNSLKMYTKYMTEVWGLEVPLYDAELGIAGRTDFVGCWNNRPTILDYKTSRRKKKAEWIEDYKLQLLYYAIAHNSMFDTNITYGVILIAVEDDLPQKFEIDFEKEDDLWVTLANRIDQFRASGQHEKIINHMETM